MKLVERAGPPMRQNHRNSVWTRRALMNEVKRHVPDVDCRMIKPGSLSNSLESPEDVWLTCLSWFALSANRNY
jgi:hypothetical protein